jgi:hypothetical protein
MSAWRSLALSLPAILLAFSISASACTHYFYGRAGDMAIGGFVEFLIGVSLVASVVIVSLCFRQWRQPGWRLPLVLNGLVAGALFALLAFLLSINLI